jgi:hypothetical protein
LKRLVCIGDLHSGHRAGLTSPRYHVRTHGDDYYRFQIESWNWYSEVIESLKPIDVLVVNGDAIDGQGHRSGASELIVVDPQKQTDIAIECIKIADAGRYIMTHGTGYHTGNDTDYERIIADALGADIASHQWIDINGTVFDIKHHVGGSSIPHGKGTSIAKEWLWSTLWATHDEQPKADVIIRSHVHYHYFCGDDSFTAMTLPALQGKGSKFGARRCSNTVHFGLVWFDIDDNGDYTWNRKLLRAVSQKQKAIVI